MSVSTTEIQVLPNVRGGKRVASESSRRLPVTAPATGEVVAQVPMSTVHDLDQAVKAAVQAQKEWRNIALRDRVQVLFRFKALLEEKLDHLAGVISLENGKTLEESKGSVLRGVECVEFATSLPQIAGGPALEVSRGIECKLVREPLGVTAGITPFNFPLMVPLWMIPMAIGLGNAFILKPSEQTPLSAMELAELFDSAGLPEGIFSVVHGDREVVEGICDHPQIRAVGFVGSSRVARLVWERCGKVGKKVRALGGAKNHLVVMPDADPDMTSSNVVASVTGCAGQRCMAASVLLAVGDVDPILEKIREKMASMRAGRDIGPIISKQAYQRIVGYLDRAEPGGARLVLDGRQLVADGVPEGGQYLGPSIIDHATPDHEASCDEIFGPTLTVIRCKDLEEAIRVENENPYGNAAAIYTSSGGVAEYFTRNVSAGMVGVNIGVPVPREPFPFGGWNMSSFGDGDLTGVDAIDFWTRAKKITTKWSDEFRRDWTT